MEERLKVLIVDDDLVDRMLVQRSIKNAGMDVSFAEAETCAQAMQILECQHFDCIFVDYQLPDRDGLSLIQSIRHLNVKAPIVALTGQGDEQIAVELMKAGAIDYLNKARIAPDSLSQILRNAVRIYRAEAEMELQRADFITHLTHDLRTPLVAADLMLKLFQKGTFGELPPETSAPLTAMIRSNQNLLEMVNTLLEVNCYDAGAKVITPIVCHMWEIGEEVVEELQALASEKGLELKLTLIGIPDDAEQMFVMGDCRELRRMITNLVGNSLKFTEAGHVELSLTISPPTPADPTDISGWVTLKVRDTGIGMSPEQQATIFQRYRKGSHKQAGSGLGLHLVQKIVTIHSGTIRVDSVVGEGSVFTIDLPLHIKEHNL
jgi:two-component system, sensor histidine kinase and response regulator